jgi:RNA polymerase sigma-70 factor (ECF subfamily)
MTAPANLVGVDWRAALRQHDRWLRAVVTGRLGGVGDVDDVMQEIALAALRQQAPLADPAKVAPWLYRVAVVQATLHRRRLGRQRKLRERFALRARPTAHDTRHAEPVDWLMRQERGALVREALRRLPPRDAEILLLKYHETWSYHDIARHLGISHSAVETRLHRARARLRELLADEESPAEPRVLAAATSTLPPSHDA